MSHQRCCIHFIVSGHVQGVWFRASTQTQAQQLGLTGWVRNKLDGCVEVLACGDRVALEQLHIWLQRGPEQAKVTEVTYEEVPWQEHTEFIIKRI